MKRTVLILLTIIYSLSSFGVSLKEFYCCGKLKTVTLTLANSHTGKCSKSQDDKCCKTKYQALKVKDSHLASSHVTIPVKNFIDLPMGKTSFISGLFVPEVSAITDGSHDPPLHRRVPLYISNCVFRV